MLIKPPRLNPGETIGIAAPASPPPDPKSIDRCVEAVERLGFKPLLASNARRRWGFLAGTDRQRAGDLMNLFSNRKVRGIFCVRGGYGTARLLPLLDYKRIRANPKALIGYSDITSLHCALLRQAGLISFHGPMLHSDFMQPDSPPFTLDGFIRTVTRNEPAGSICRGYRKKTVRIIRRGTASGRLVGGNLSVLLSTIGTRYQPSFKNSILFLEDVDEAPYRLDRMLTHLLNAGLLQKVAGIAFGINRNCLDPKAAKAREYRQTQADVLEERLSPLKIPVLAGLPFGHIPFNATLPVGARARLDAVRGDLIITEPAVTRANI